MSEMVVDPAIEKADSTSISLDQLNVTVDSQTLNSMNFCPEKYRMEHIEHWRPQVKGLAMEKGSVMHEMLKVYRRGKRAGRTSLAEHGTLVQEALKAGAVSYSAYATMTPEDFEVELQTFREYVLKWQYDGWEILDVEEPFTRLLYEDHEPIEYGGHNHTGLSIYYEGIIDARIRDPRMGVMVVDSKTESRRSYPYVLSNQFQGYEWAWGVPVVIDKIGWQQTLEATEDIPDDQGRDKSKFRRMVSDSGSYGVEEWKSDSIEQVKQAIQWHRDLASGKRTTLQKNRTSCDKYSGCVFQRVCKVPEETREYKLLTYFIKTEPWDVYTRDDDDIEPEKSAS